MSKEIFLNALRERLSFLPSEDIEERTAFYGEMIDDRIEEGMTEEEAIEAVGSIDSITEQIMSETPLPRLVMEKVKPKRRLKVWEIVLLTLGFPVWGPLLLAAVIILLAVYVVIWVVVVCVYAVDLFLAAGAVLAIPSAVNYLFLGRLPVASFTLGAGVALAGLAILMLPVSMWITREIVKLTGRSLLWVKSLFIKKEDIS